MTKCPSCNRRKLQNSEVHIVGIVKDRNFTVSMDGLRCYSCGYSTIRGRDSAEFSRRLADKYKLEYRLLTSDDLRQARQRLKITQEDMSRESGISIASIKRYELGKIQERLYDSQLRKVLAELERRASNICEPFDAEPIQASYVTACAKAMLIFQRDVITDQSYQFIQAPTSYGLFMDANALDFGLFSVMQIIEPNAITTSVVNNATGLGRIDNHHA